MSFSKLYTLTYWALATLFILQDLSAPTSLLRGALTGAFHAAELYLAMDLLWFFILRLRRWLR